MCLREEDGEGETENMRDRERDTCRSTSRSREREAEREREKERERERERDRNTCVVCLSRGERHTLTRTHKLHERTETEIDSFSKIKTKHWVTNRSNVLFFILYKYLCACM